MKFELPDLGHGLPDMREGGDADYVIQRAVKQYGLRRDAVDLYRRVTFARMSARAHADEGLVFPGDRAVVRLADVPKLRNKDGSRSDAVDATPYAAAAGGPFALRELEYVFSQPLFEQHPDQNALRLFPISNRVPIGARYYTHRLYTSQGTAKYIDGANWEMIQGGQVAMKEQRRFVHYIGTNVRINTIEALSADYAQISLQAMNVSNAHRSYRELLNTSMWTGVPELDIWGVFNYPGLASVVSDVPFDGSAAPDVVKDELFNFSTYAPIVSKQVFSPTRWVTSPRVAWYLRRTRMSGYNDTTIAKFFKENRGLPDPEEAWECEGVGPGGTDAIFFWRDDINSIAAEVVQGLTPLPVQYTGYDQLTPMYAAYGGMTMSYIGNNFLAYVTPPDITANMIDAG